MFSRVMRTRPARAAARVLLPPAERVVAAVTRGRLQLSSALVPSLTLRTTGARSGQPRETVLMCMPEDGTWIVVGSNFGEARHPAWTANLLAHPEALIRFRGRVTRVAAELVVGAEREAIWVDLEAQWPDYRAYERDAGRELRIFRLTPVRRGGENAPE
ncbi:MAG: nitroreductase family deazaflavin-dependent oxidoreductase [Microbacteriaceae bacterium]|nr:nitroreductase family deazaflavin-dependent oxidoreductase [Microbacteriaceae bacterium]